MTVQFLCPRCERSMLQPLPPLCGVWECPQCGESRPFHLAVAGAGSGDSLKQCVVCAGERFYSQRDFNQRIGCLVAGIGAALSPFTYGISLLVCLLIDGLLYLLLKQATVCYRCGSIYRGLAGSVRHEAFDLHVAELEANERKYLEPDQ